LTSKKSYAQVGYEAYGDSVEWKNYMGVPMPQWEVLSDKVKVAWAVAANAILDKSNKDQQDVAAEHGS